MVYNLKHICHCQESCFLYMVQYVFKAATFDKVPHKQNVPHNKSTDYLTLKLTSMTIHFSFKMHYSLFSNNGLNIMSRHTLFSCLIQQWVGGGCHQQGCSIFHVHYEGMALTGSTVLYKKANMANLYSDLTIYYTWTSVLKIYPMLCQLQIRCLPMWLWYVV